MRKYHLSKTLCIHFLEYSYVTNNAAVAGAVLIKVGLRPLYKALIPSVLTISFIKTNAGVFKFWT